MIHKGNISKIKITPEDIVDCVIGGSPCQGLSVAGARAGLDDERSGLFMEQIRVMKEMRALDQASGRTGIHVRCRWGIWENVPGALSSNGGEDFRIVLEEFCKVADPDASVPRPANGKWNSSGCIVGDSYSVAWRILDARYHGVPQRRRRITLVADFAGRCAPRYYLTAKACTGILNRAKKRGKELPEMLRETLEEVVALSTSNRIL